MSQPFVGEIRMFGGSFAPAGWAMCDGQLQPISQNETLFNLIGTTYGGDGQETFALPDLQGRIPLHQGTNPGTGTTFQIAQKDGVESVTITTNTLPTHNHAFVASQDGATGNAPTNNLVASATNIKNWSPFPPTGNMNANALMPIGGSQPHENMMPFLVVTYIISLFGIFPTQT
jgi:microcystin-dependent protein